MNSEQKPKRGRGRPKGSLKVAARRGRPKKTVGRPRKVKTKEGAAERAKREAKERSKRLKDRSIKQHLIETSNLEKQNTAIQSAKSVHIELVNDNVSSALEEIFDHDVYNSTVEEETVENEPSNYREIKTESRVEFELDMESEDEGDEIENSIQNSPIQRASSRSSDNDSVISYDGIASVDVESKIEDNYEEQLYCSACLNPCAIESFLSHIIETHSPGIRSECFSTFKTPVLLPKHRFLLPKVLQETIDGDENINWDSYCNKCNINYNNKDEFERHLTDYHKEAEDTSSNSGRDNPHLHCITCDLHLTDRDSIIQHLTYEHPTLDGEKITSNNNSESDINNSTKKPSATNSSTPDSLERFSGISKYDLFCNICGRECNGISAYKIHFLRVHRTRISPVNSKRILHPDIIPDITNPNFYCAACEKYFLNFKTFSGHINYVHNIYPKSFKPPSNAVPRLIAPSVLPSLNNPALYCAGCDKRYKTTGYYYNHLRTVHHYDISHHQNNLSFDQTCCTLCMKMFPDWKSCSYHVQKSHDLTLAPHVSLDDFKCDSCQKLYFSLRDVYNHLTREHELQPKIRSEIETTLSQRLKPRSSQSISIAKRKRMTFKGIQKRETECTLCGKKFPSKYSLGIHKEEKHNVFFIYDDLFFCNLCDSSLVTKAGYIYHLKHQHLIDEIPDESDEDVAETSIPYQKPKTKRRKCKKSDNAAPKTRNDGDEESNGSSTNAYCKLCDLHYNTPVYYRLHCLKNHNSD